MSNGNRKGSDWNARFNKASQIINKFNNNIKSYQNPNPGSPQTVEIEFGDDSGPAQNKSAPIQKLYETNNMTVSQARFQPEIKPQSNSYSYNIEGGVLLTCRIDEWGKGFSLFGDFVRDAKKYYRKTCINANYIYFFSYRPMYKELSHEQLCWYLFWRSKIREGTYPKTGLSYIFLYLYEQINLSDIIGPEKVYENIIKIWKNYRAEFPRIDKYIAEWLIDFTFINQMKIDLNDIEDILSSIINIVTIPEVYLRGDFFKNKNNAETIINNMSVYDHKKSKFYNEKNKELFDYHIAQILNLVLSGEGFEEILKKEIDDGVKIRTTRESYMGAVCAYEHKRRITVEFKNLYKNFFIRQCITDTVRAAENALRDYLNIKSKLPVTAYPEKLRKIIEEYKDKYLAVVKTPKISVKTKGKKNVGDDDINEHGSFYVPQFIEFNPNIQAAAEIEKESWDTTMTLVELQNRDSREMIEIIEDESIDALDFPEDLEDDGEFIAIDTGTAETYEELDEIAPVNVRDGALDVPLNNDIDIFDILEKLETPEKTDIGKFVANLTDEEHTVLEMLLSAKEENKSFDILCVEYLNRSGGMLESVVDIINEKAMDFTGDIIFDTANQEMIEDYREEMEKYIKNNK